MKPALLLVILTMVACSGPNKQEPIANLNVSLDQGNGTNTYETADTLRNSGAREYLDSANFHIIRGKYLSGNKFIEVYENKLSKLDSWKEYYENGLIKEEGVMTNANHIYVGVWKYYSITGVLDSIIDYDKRYPISYFDALKIAEKNGLKMPDMELSLQVDGLNTFWQIARWTNSESNTYRH